MRFERPSLEEALIAAAQEFGCSVVALRYEVLQHPRRGLLGLFARGAIIEASAPGSEQNAEKPVKKPQQTSTGGAEMGDKKAADNAKQSREKSSNRFHQSAQNITKTAPAKGVGGAAAGTGGAEMGNKKAVKSTDGMRMHMQPPEPLNAEQIELCRAQIEHLLCMVTPVKVAVLQLDCGALSVRIDCDEPERLLGRENFKFESLDLLINHYTNIAFSCHARVDVAGSLAAMRQRLERSLERARTLIEQNGRASLEPLSPTLLNIAYEQLAREYAHKIINIKEAAAGRYICIWGRYDEHHRASSKRKH